MPYIKSKEYQQFRLFKAYEEYFLYHQELEKIIADHSDDTERYNKVVEKLKRLSKLIWHHRDIEAVFTEGIRSFVSRTATLTKEKELNNESE